MKKELEKILYVDDEADIRFIVQIALEDIGGFTIKCCATGYEAVMVVEEFKPDLILLDVMMPGLDGPATLKALRDLPEIKNVPVIFMTARIQEKEVFEYKTLGILGVISKPFEPMILAGMLRDYWSRYDK